MVGTERELLPPLQLLDVRPTGKSGRHALRGPESNAVHASDDQFVVELNAQGERVLATLDTGAENTDLFAGFADQFTSLVKETGKRDFYELQGVGGTERIEAITMPALTLGIGGRDTVLSPARVLHKGWRKCCAVNVGMDLLKQARSFKLDFGAMTLALEGNP